MKGQIVTETGNGTVLGYRKPVGRTGSQHCAVLVGEGGGSLLVLQYNS
nr:hypothetical protein [Desulfobulbaceae bacterium]